MNLKSNDSLRLISWNVNGLRAVLQKGFLDFLEISHADVICLQEIKARPDQVADVQWPAGWQIAWNPATKPGYSGVATFTKSPLVATTLGMGDPVHDGEGRILTSEFEHFYLVNVYVPNSQRELTRLLYRTQEWEPAFLAFLHRLRKQKPVVVCGDLNVAHEEIDLARPKDNVGNAGFTIEERECFRTILASGFRDSFRQFQKNGGHYSWWSYQHQARIRNIGWRIDYFLMTEELLPRLSDAFIWPEVSGSDHCPIGIDLQHC